MNAQLFTCKVDATLWMASLEYARIHITTPKGTRLDFDKWPSAKSEYKWTENESVASIIRRAYSNSFEGNNTIDLTKEEVLLLAQYSQYQSSDVNRIKQAKALRDAGVL